MRYFSILFCLVSIYVSNINAQSNTCNGSLSLSFTQSAAPNNSLCVNASGGSSPYSYVWGNSSGTGITNNCITLSATTNTYSVTVTDASGCTVSAIYNTNCNNMQANISVGANNQVCASTANTSAQYTYQWSAGGATSTGSCTNLIPTTAIYCVTATDVNNSTCQFVMCESISTSTSNPCNYYLSTSSTPSSPGTIYNFIANSTVVYDSIYWEYGDGTTQMVIGSNTTSWLYIAPGVYIVRATAYIAGSACNTVLLTINVQSPPNAELCGVVFNDANGNGIQDAGEPPIANATVYVSGGNNQFSVSTDANGYYLADVTASAGSAFYIRYCAGNGNTMTLPTGVNGAGTNGSCGSYTVVNVMPGDSICGYNFGVQYTAVTISGAVFQDSNGNGSRDAGEVGVANAIVRIGNYYAYTDVLGNYSIIVPAGTYTITYQPPYNTDPCIGINSGVPNPNSIVVNATTPGNTYGNNNFGLNQPALVQYDLGINISNARNLIRRGFDNDYTITIRNNGTSATAGTAVMQYSNSLSYTACVGCGTMPSNDMTLRRLTWNFPSLNPGSSMSYHVRFMASLSTPLGTVETQIVGVQPISGADGCIYNNYDSVRQIISDSYDPNNKISIQSNHADPNLQYISSINGNQQITYTINFQNEGNADAINIVVNDLLSSDLIANSYEFESSSHPCVVTRNGNNVVYKFSNINLPPKNENEPASHGFVTFKVNAQNGLPVGNTIQDYSDIYFDFNSAVRTDNSNVTLVGATGLSDFAENISFDIIPNIICRSGKITINSTLSDHVVIQVVDISGKKLEEIYNDRMNAGKNQIIWETSLSKGIYFVQLISGKKTLSKRMVVQ